MSPIHHDDNLSQWARSTGSPIISIDYGKAPEYPYPYALEEIFDAYRSILDTNGRCIGIESEEPLKIVVMGDSAGGNLATGLVMKIIDFGCRLPSSLILVYPCLSFDIACWMSHNDLQMMEMDKRLDRVVQSKVELNKFDPLQIPDAPRSMNVERDSIDDSPSWFSRKENGESRIHSGLSMTSRMSYFGDRILNPEMLRSMALMYLADR